MTTGQLVAHSFESNRFLYDMPSGSDSVCLSELVPRMQHMERVNDWKAK